MNNSLKQLNDSYDSEVNEILASIRQIMSHEDETEEQEDVSEIINFPEKRFPASSQGGEDILNLTNVVMNDGSVTSLNYGESQMVAEVDKKQKNEENAETAGEDKKNEELNLTEDESIEFSSKEGPAKQGPSKEEIDSLMSEDAVALSSRAFKELGKLNDRMKEKITNDTFGDQTIEQLMRELLRPMLKEWLDSHLPSLVKWLVAEKIEQMIKQEQEQEPQPEKKVEKKEEVVAEKKPEKSS